MKIPRKIAAAVTLLLLIISSTTAQKINEQTKINDKTFAELEFRSIGPALMSGRISDIAIHPDNENIWYICAGSGGVWKTENSGTTWEPIFDDQEVYSIGCITIDPNNPHTIWVGTGENVGGRHVSFGNGIYKSLDGGASWKNMGLKTSQHISKIIVHPKNPEIIWVASQGPLWSKGGERGLFKSCDGGATWKKNLGDNEWTGVTDIIVDPRNPDVMYAATWQRARTVAAYMGGGPGSGIYKSTNGGESWTKLKKGLPNSDYGKIGLAISPQNPDIIYAAIELNRRKGGIYKSDNRGESWTKMSEAVSGGTGPHYYQELYASPHKFDKIYLVDVRIQVSEDGGKTFKRLKEKNKHSDNHAIAFRKNDADYLLVGTDGGIYETFDGADNWKYISNLPLTQFYKVAIDDSKPFYNVYGGTQDNGTQTGPSQTNNNTGIVNSDWSMVLYADGHQPATIPGNPNIVYCEWQEGNLSRVDRTTGEIIFIQPQPAAGEDYERYNWDAPILVSPHNPDRVYFASQRVWKSNNKGDSWEAISGDLTKNEERITLPVMGKTWSWDSPWDVYAMSNYNTITSLAESPLKEGLIYAGTDDGLIQVTEDGGSTWKKIKVSSLDGVPETAFVNDIKADLFDENKVYVVLDNHKYGDFKPYIYSSNDKGKTWKSISGNLKEPTIVWRIVQDHINPKLMFVGTEFGIFTTLNGGNNWVKLSGGLPTISFRDLAIHKEENDLIGASFGRGFFVLDDYSALRKVTPDMIKNNAKLFATNDAYWYIPRPSQTFGGKGSQGASYFVAPNPPFGATFTYYLPSGYKTKKEIRISKEKQLKKEGKNILFPGWDNVESEHLEESPAVLLIIKDKDGDVVRRIKCKTNQGFHRVTWDLKTPSSYALSLQNSSIFDENSSHSGFLVMPGVYTAELVTKIDGEISQLSEPINFNVIPLYDENIESSSYGKTVSFYNELNEMQMRNSALNVVVDNVKKKIAAMRKAYSLSSAQDAALYNELFNLKESIVRIEKELYGNKSKNEIGEKNNPSISSRINVANQGVRNSTYGPTPTHIMSLNIAKTEFTKVKEEVNNIVNDRIPMFEKKLIDMGAPWIEGQEIP